MLLVVLLLLLLQSFLHVCSENGIKIFKEVFILNDFN